MFLMILITFGSIISPILSLSATSIRYRINELFGSQTSLSPSLLPSSSLSAQSPSLSLSLSSRLSSPYVYQIPQSSPYKQLLSVFEARNLEFAFPTETDRILALVNGNYKPDVVVPIDVDVYYPIHSQYPRVFVSIPRFGSGVPYSLAQLTNVLKPNGTELTAFPNYYWHDSHGYDCNDLTSVYRTQIDSCGRMWILDSGEINFIQHCPPQLVVIDLETDTEVHRYRLPKGMFKAGISRFVTPIIDVADNGPHGTCQHVMVYMADVTGFGIVVYDVRTNRSWRIQNKYTYPDPNFATLTIAGESFELLDGILGMSLTPKHLGLRRMLYFHGLCNDAQIAVPLDVVNNYTLWKTDDKMASLDQFILLGKRGVQCGAEAMTSHGILLCGFLEPIAIVGWNIRTQYTGSNRHILAENPDTLQFVSGLKVIVNPSGKEEVWMVSNRLQKVSAGTINYHDINYRIQRCGVNELLHGEACLP